MVRQLRLASGLILFAFLLVHFGNHAVGLVSLAAMEGVLRAVYPVIASLPVTTLLSGALLVHLGLALWALWQRRSLRLPAPDAAQYLLGFMVPVLAAPHLVATRIAGAVHGEDVGYYRNVLVALWRDAPLDGVLQAALLLAAWGHACFGLRFWLRTQVWFTTVRPLLFGAALLIPALGLAGYVTAGREVMLRLALDPAFGAGLSPSPEVVARDAALVGWIRAGFLGLLGGVLLARGARRQLQLRRGLVRITYPGGRPVEVTPGTSVLEASRLAGIPHAAVCGGKGRCSTCRVRVKATAAEDPPGAAEQRVLERVGASPGVRLACQFRPRGAVAVAPLLAAGLPAPDLLARRPGYRQGAEREIAILFADLRDFTRISEARLPFDVVHILNRYFDVMGGAVEAAGGRVDKFIGDGVMALFGIGEGEDAAGGCRAALAAARMMSERLAALNRAMELDIAGPLRIGIGLHTGSVIVGDMGFGQTMALTAIGDAVNTASRLETACKPFDAELVVSEALLERAGVTLPDAPRHEIAIRGRAEMLAVRVMERASALP